MLIEFSVENYRSIKEKVTLSMVASADKSMEDNLTTHEGPLKHELLNSAVIYGANASGKSNVLRALAEFQAMVIWSHTVQKGMRLNYTPFAFDPVYRRMPTRFMASILVEGVMYEYEMAYDSEKIVEEHLHYYPNKKRAKVFSREGQEFKFNRDQKEQEVLSRRTIDNALYLSTSVQQNYEITRRIYHWFFDNLITISPGPIDHLVEGMLQMMDESAQFKKSLLVSLKEADMGIKDVVGRILRVPVEDMQKQLPPDMIQVIERAGGMSTLDVRVLRMFLDDDGIVHRGSLHLQDESEGTQRFLSYIGPIVDSLSNGKILVIDEMDAKLHPMLSEWIVGVFHNPIHNAKGAQLVFNTHDALLLDQDIFRRDQIWFTEKSSKTGATSLYSLLEFRERKDRSLMKGYLLGRYGAIPSPKHGRII